MKMERISNRRNMVFSAPWNRKRSKKCLFLYMSLLVMIFMFYYITSQDIVLVEPSSSNRTVGGTIIRIRNSATRPHDDSAESTTVKIQSSVVDAYHQRTDGEKLTNVTMKNNDGNDDVVVAGAVDEPQVVWLMSFGGSGTSYTITNTEKASNTTTASNYASDYKKCVSVHNDDKNSSGPFLRSPQKQLPPAFILSKTHCGGFCMDCEPSNYVHTLDSFALACRTGTTCEESEKDSSSSGSNKVPATYDSNVPVRAVHMYRNPFDNLVGRYHLAIKNKRKRNHRDDLTLLDSLTNDEEGFHRWCRYLDDKFRTKEQDASSKQQMAMMVSDTNYTSVSLASIYRKYESLPCHAEWFRYVQWHNLATQVTSNMGLPVLSLYYENYTNSLEATVDELFSFLQLERVDPFIEFIHGKTYASFFDREEMQTAATMVRELALPDVWKRLQHYFDPFVVTDDSISSSAHLTEETKDIPVLEKWWKAKAVEETVGVKERAHIPRVAWLMSFPNSGTSYTIMNTEKMSNTTTASNYGGTKYSILPLHADIPEGPFIHRLESPLPRKYILTKTHCAGFCNECQDYIVATDHDFERGCRSGHNYVKGVKTKVVYPATIPEKAVHLIRNPFDNIVSRFHLALKHQARQEQEYQPHDGQYFAATFNNSREGFRSWCRTNNENKASFAVKKSPLFSEDSFIFLAGIPCYADFFRYVQWHNYAIDTIKELGLEFHVLHYENYTTNYVDTTKELYDFLKLPLLNDPLPFISGKTYIDWFEPQETKAVAQFIRTLATPDSWSLLRHYFDEDF